VNLYKGFRRIKKGDFGGKSLIGASQVKLER
jgi:hypothetical protein